MGHSDDQIQNSNVKTQDGQDYDSLKAYYADHPTLNKTVRVTEDPFRFVKTEVERIEALDGQIPDAEYQSSHFKARTQPPQLVVRVGDAVEFPSGPRIPIDQLREAA